MRVFIYSLALMFVFISCSNDNNESKEVEKRKIKKTTVTTHKVENFETDSSGYVVTVEEFDKHGNTISYIRNADPRHIETQYTVDIKYSGDTTAVEKTYNYTVPAGKKEIITYVYGSNGKLERTKKVMNGGKVLAEMFNYDENGKILSQYGNDGSFIEYEYNENGKLKEKKISYSYDRLDKNRKLYYYDEKGYTRKIVNKAFDRELYFQIFEFKYENGKMKEEKEFWGDRYLSTRTYTYNDNGYMASRLIRYGSGGGYYYTYEYEYYK